MFRGILAGGVALSAAGLILTGPAAYADLKAPYARAAAIVDADGELNNGKNVVKSWRASIGRYCVQIERQVAASGALVQLTSRAPRRLPFVAYRNPSAICNEPNTITIGVYDVDGRLADGGFDLSIA
ncbi:hypothetical protein ACIBIZ_23825 [Nonomuraea spiralis]|uniref:hypothetical protein n=1 Tax=Nonomuraea TaxID=83681 RepID=UPI000F7756CE|nr:hypothetical protein [Nonomuraea sp. WAC 01424]RSN10292.1 hypothetical protein DMB42_15230 [Nonomuraea sp. WAC 01424]